jgi:hypothetical protein
VDFDSAACENIGEIMSPEELRKLILSDREAKKLAESGAADMCAARCRAIAPKETRETLLTELSILRLSADPITAETILQTMEAIATQNPLLKRALKWMQPGAPGLDFGNPVVRQMLTLPVESGGVGLTEEQARPLLAAAEVEPSISGADVSTAWPFGVE